MSTKKTTKKEIKALLTIMGREYKAKGKTVDEVIDKLKPEITKTHAVITLEKGDLKKERIINAKIVQALFGMTSPTTRQITRRNFAMLFNDFN